MVLGVRWNVDEDHIVLDIQKSLTTADVGSLMKRHIAVSKFYNPLGLLSPIIIKMNLFLQKVCLATVGWDDELSDELKKKWKLLFEELRDSDTVRMPRYYLAGVQEEVKSYRLCGFGDASKGAYARVVYLLVETSIGFTLRIVGAKTRVAPTQILTIPRFELLAALLLARLVHSITESLNSEMELFMSTCYTDAKVALHWILVVKRSWKMFVQNRVNEIRKLVPKTQWRHCAGMSNPADLPSRGVSPGELKSTNLWFNGPDGLAQGIMEDKPELEMPDKCIVEMKDKLFESDESTCCLTVTEEVGCHRSLSVRVTVTKEIHTCHVQHASLYQ
uniref:Uncharacterized protein n=1 Tax=Amphimedon queenslandica TaxID=400682 RepID=A0A1X7UC75_AMPQE